MTTQAFRLAGQGSPRGDVPPQRTPAPPVPPSPCIHCGGFRADHVTAGHVYETQGQCISCENEGWVKDHWTGHLVCTTCYMKRYGVIG